MNKQIRATIGGCQNTSSATDIIMTAVWKVTADLVLFTVLMSPLKLAVIWK